MATLQYELEHGVLSKVEEDEPIFVLRANDPVAGKFVELYSGMLEMAGNEEKKISCEAVARAMEAFESGGKDVKRAVEVLGIRKFFQRKRRAMMKKREAEGS